MKGHLLPGGRRPLVRTVLTCGCSLALSLAFFDIAYTILIHTPTAFQSVSAFLTVLAVSATAVFVAYLLSWWAGAPLLARLFGLDLVGLTFALTLLIAAFFFLATLTDLHFLPPGAQDYPLLTIAIVSALTVAWGGYSAVSVIGDISRCKRIIATITLAAPTLLAETVALVWLLEYSVQSASLPRRVLCIGAFLLMGVATIVVLRRLAPRACIEKWLGMFLVVVVVCPAAVLVFQATQDASRRRHIEGNREVRPIILLTIDTLRADALTCYSRGGATTPNIDRLAADSLVFTAAFSPSPWTLPAVTSLMSGTLPAVHQVTHVGQRVPDNLLTLAEYMREVEYYTTAIGYSPMLLREGNMCQGFVEYQFFPDTLGRSFGARLLRRFVPSRAGIRRSHSTSYVTHTASEFLSSSRDKDIFLWLHYYDPHLPYEPPGPFLPDMGKPARSAKTSNGVVKEIRGGGFVPTVGEQAWLEELYQAEVRYVDAQVGKVLDVLRREGVYDRSLIVLVSDHGEEFWEHDGFEHGHSLYNELIHVPLLIKLPYSSHTGRIDEPVSTAAITPTILDICGIDYEAESFSVGSLSAIWSDSDAGFRAEPVVSCSVLWYGEQESVIFDGLKYIRSCVTGREELFDLTTDPGELSPVARSTEGVERARGILKQVKERAERQIGALGVEGREGAKLDIGTVRELRALGYIGEEGE